MKRLLVAILFVLGIAPITPAQAQTPNAWSSEDYTFYAGDFNGDGFTDILYVARTPSLPSGILLSDGTAPTIQGQTWASNYLGIPWSSGAYTVVVGDFNGDGKTDIFLQSNGPGDSYLILTDSSGVISAISQTIPERAMGIDWSADRHHLVVGDFNGDGHADLFFQPTLPGGTSAVVNADANGQFTSAAPAQTWGDGYLGFKWSVQDANVFAGDFNGDRRADLLIQAQPITGEGSNESSALSYPPNMNGVVLAHSGTKPFTLTGVQAWSRHAFGVDWSPITNNLIIADFNGDGRSDVLLQPLEAGGTASLVFGRANGPIFTTATGALPADVSISADAVVLVTGRFAGGTSAGLLLQSTSRAGSNSIAKNISRGVHPRAIAFPVLTPSSVSTSGIGYPGGASARPQSMALPPRAKAATVAPSSAGRTAAQFSVTPTGAASYNIPLWTPPGAREIEPHLALHYTSGGPDGPMGPGWTLTGTSAIVRCGKTWASSNGAPAGVTLSTSDDICLDGNRLRLISGSPLGAGSQYQTEIADFSLVIASSTTTGNGPQYFTVYGKDGRYYEYGNSATSQIFASGATTPYAWALSKVRDRQGNNMVFTYSGGTVLQLTTIQYTATPGTGNAAPYEVDFSYVARTGGTTITKYVAGGLVTQSQQLDNVNVLASGTSVRKYQLGYQASVTTNRPLLQTVQECGGSAGTDCIRPTTITYQTGGAGWSTTATAAGVDLQYGYQLVDFNGDGYLDLFYDVRSGSTDHFYVRFGSASGFGPQIDPGITNGGLAANFLGNGKAQILSGAKLYSWSGSGFTSSNVTLPSGGIYSVVDWDGDGLPDAVGVSADGLSVTVTRNTTVSGGTLTFGGPTTTVYTGGNPLISNGVSVTAVVDFNGDGRGDLIVTDEHCPPQQNTCHDADIALISNGFGAAATSIRLGAAGHQPADVNGDGCTDLVSASDIQIGNCAGGFTSVSSAIPVTGVDLTTVPLLLLDWDGDGQTDRLYADPNTHMWYVQRSTGSGFASSEPTGIPAPVSSGFSEADTNSDGQPDLIAIDATNSYAASIYPHNGFDTPPDLANSITDGFGINFSPTYVPISQYNYTKCVTGGSCTLATFPDIDFQGPMYVVNQFSASDGTGSTYTNDFSYWYARLNLQGRGFEGFYAARQRDSRSGIWVLSYYLQQFPYIGSLYDQETIGPDAVTYLGITGSTYSYTTPGGLTGTKCGSCYFPFISDSIVYNYEPTGSKAGGANSYISYTKTHYTYDNYGNLTDTLATTEDTDSATPASPFNGQYWITEIKNTIANDSSGNWCLGRPSTTTTTKTVPGQAAETRTVGHTIDNANCRATVETVEPNDTRLQVTTTFGFDACGNTNSVSVVGLDKNGAAMPARITKTNYNYSTSRCALPEAVTNALNQTTVTAYNYNFGLPSSTTDPNGIVTASLQYDDFGRKTQETRPDGTYTKYTYTDCVSSSCWGVADLRFLTQINLYSSAGTSLRQENKYYDGLDRERYDERNRVLGTWTTTYTTYDSLGRKASTFLPYSSGPYGTGYHVYSYDVANRITKDVLYTDANALYRAINMWYEGQTAFVADPNGNQISKVTDVGGKIRQVTDDGRNAVAGTTYYTFDPFGNLSKVVDADGVASSYTYNIRGFKTLSNDADAGAWTFTPDSLNELVSQTDAKGQVTSFGYDLLGRMTQRTEPESTTPTQWTYGSSATAHNIGRISQILKPDTSQYAETYTYDSIGRPATIAYTEDGTNYYFGYAYNASGTLDTLTYPYGPSGYRLVLKSVYDGYGYLNQLKDNAAGTVFWTLNSANDSSLPTSETLGNGVQVATSYTPWTNETFTRTEGSGGSTTNLQSLTYHWDLAGNLHQRIDNRQNLTEQFGYDSMNRLQNSTLNGATNLTLTYDAAGNIATKSDVSASPYAYDPAHPHAVKTAGSWSMSYDADGNMITRAGGSISWYSYNLPNTISYSGNSTQFFYNANHQRWKQVAHYAGTTETTHYAGGLLEVMTRGAAPTEYRYQIPAGSSTAVLTKRSDGTSGTYYATSDHLGSSDLVLDSSANVLARESFTPFGARRGSTWQGVPTASDYTEFGNTTRKGFTGHEMLDSVALVHMNGRVYDPYLGRFLSADTVIQSLGATESINPYAYAWNEPLKYIDPSGHSLFGDLIGLIVGIIVAVVLPELLPEYFSALSVGTLAVAGFVGGFVGAYISTGSLSAALTAGLIAGITAGAFAEVGSYAAQLTREGSEWATPFSVVAHAAVGCVSTAASGGNCGRGALAAGISEAAYQEGLFGTPPKSLASWGTLKGAAEAGLLGGIAARIMGGKFDDGFTVSAAGYIFNSAADELKDSRARHDAAVAQEVKLLTSQGYSVLGTEQYAENPELPFLRRYDIVAQDPAGTIFGVEVKTTVTGIFKLDPQQVQFDVDTVQGGTTLLSTGIPVTGVMYRGVNFGGTVDAIASTLRLAEQLNAQSIPWHYTYPPLAGQ